MIVREIGSLGVTDSIGDEVLVQSKVVIRSEPCESFAGFFRRSFIDVDASLAQKTVGEVMADRSALLKILEHSQLDSGCLCGYGRRGYESRRGIDIASGIGGRKCNRSSKSNKFLIDGLFCESLL